MYRDTCSRALVILTIRTTGYAGNETLITFDKRTQG